MEYMYAALLLHKAGQPVNEENLKKVLTAAGTNVDEGRVKAVVAALEGANIEEIIEKASAMAAAPAAAAPVAGGEAAPAAEEKPKVSEEDEKKKEEEAAAGLGALFG